jgi:hypothetical protein
VSQTQASNHRSRAAKKAAAKEQLADAAYRWWLEKRPAGWSREGHILDAGIGCKGVLELALAFAVAEYAKHLS